MRLCVVVSRMERQACVRLKGHEGGREREEDVSVGFQGLVRMVYR
jgi:hypothetical protein